MTNHEAATLSRVLTRNEVLWFLLGALFCFVFPLINSQYLFYDDIWRAFEGRGTWSEEGRFLITVFYNLMAFDGQVPNVFPLPLFMAVVLLSFALRDLVFWCFDQPVLTSCLVVLPIMYTPFFLQNLTYQFDGALMVMGLGVVIYSIIYRCDSHFKRWGVSIVCLVVALAIYQVLINLFVILCCFEVIRSLENKRPAAWVLSRLVLRGACLVIAVAIYYACVYWFLSNERLSLLAFNTYWLFEVVGRLSDTLTDLVSIFPPAINVIMCVVLALACLGYVRVGLGYIRNSDSRFMRVLVWVVYLCCVPVLLFFISGIMLFFTEFNNGFRTLLGFSGVMFVVFYLAHKMLFDFFRWSAFILALPLFYCLSISYSYGHILLYQKMLEGSVLTGLSYDIQHSQFSRLERLYLISAEYVEALPAAQGLNDAIPILQCLNFGYVVISEMLPSVGVINVYRNTDETIAASIRANVYSPILTTRFYNFYIVDGEGYILMNNIKSQFLPMCHSCR